MKEKKIKLNIGCGRDYRDGYTNLDISSDVGADVVADIEKCIPFRTNTFDEVLCYNVLTQILYPKTFLQVMNDLWRITKADGFIEIRVPLAKYEYAFQDPMDCRRFTDQSFTYMEEGHRRYEQYGKHYGFKPFKVKILDKKEEQMYIRLIPIKNV